MDRKTHLRLMTYVTHLIKTKATGTPKDLARRFDVSERTIYRLLRDIRDLNDDQIEFSFSDNSYRMKEEKKIKF